jgi:UDP-2,4-diacetamido-2,4,6-trideoxy-beta-L-altropyranose hydrolase
MTDRRPAAAEPSLAVFRADAGADIGGGHVMRCLTLAYALRDHGWACAFAVNAEAPKTVPALADPGFQVVVVDDGAERQARSAEWLLAALERRPELLVVDSYTLDARYERAARNHGIRVLTIDDLADRPHDCDLLLDQTLARDASAYAGLVPAGARVLLGPRYALLRLAFRERRDAALAERAGRAGVLRRVLAAGGATDPAGIGLQALSAVARTGLELDLDIVVGGSCPDLPALRRGVADQPRAALHVDVDAPAYAGLLSRADVCIGAGGTGSWERCCLGLPTLACVVAANQAAIVDGLCAAGAALRVDFAGRAGERVDRALAALAADPHRLMAMAEAAAAVCDGGGTLRVVAEALPGAALAA